MKTNLSFGLIAIGGWIGRFGILLKFLGCFGATIVLVLGLPDIIIRGIIEGLFASKIIRELFLILFIIIALVPAIVIIYMLLYKMINKFKFPVSLLALIGALVGGYLYFILSKSHITALSMWGLWAFIAGGSWILGDAIMIIGGCLRYFGLIIRGHSITQLQMHKSFIWLDIRSIFK